MGVTVHGIHHHHDDGHDLVGDRRDLKLRVGELNRELNHRDRRISELEHENRYLRRELEHAKPRRRWWRRR